MMKKLLVVGLLAFTGLCHSESTNCDPEAENDEIPQHRVNIRPFQMSQTEVTLGQFKKFIVAAGRKDLLTDDFKKRNNQGDNAPVEWVSWNDAQDFIQWLNKVSGGGWRLPSEAEWEYACRAGGNHRYCGSNNPDEVAWHSGNSGKHAHAVGQKTPNAFGLYDMSGNVFEWVQDYYHDNYNGAPTNGSAWTSGGEQKDRVVRGGSWDLGASSSSAANRLNRSPGHPYDGNGLRLARTR